MAYPTYYIDPKKKRDYQASHPSNPIYGLTPLGSSSYPMAPTASQGSYESTNSDSTRRSSLSSPWESQNYSPQAYSPENYSPANYSPADYPRTEHSPNSITYLQSHSYPPLQPLSVSPVTPIYQSSTPTIPNSEDPSGRRSRVPSTKGSKAFACLHPHCPSSAAFTRAADVDRHMETVHGTKGAKRFDCEYEWCGRVGGKGFTRKDHRTEHIRTVHMIDIPKVKRGGKRSG